MGKRIFILDDDANVIRLASDFLKQEGHSVYSANDPAIGLPTIRANPPDLLLLDINMPFKDGFEVCKVLKSDLKTKSIPIIILSVQAQEEAVVQALNLGADDFVTKPYRNQELLARISAVLRRHPPNLASERLIAGALTLDRGTYKVSIGKTPIELAPKEFELLAFFLQHEGRVLTRGTIAEHVWGREHSPSSVTIEYHVKQLRKKLGKLGSWIKTLTGVGYRLEAEDEQR